MQSKWGLNGNIQKIIKLMAIIFALYLIFSINVWEEIVLFSKQSVELNSSDKFSKTEQISLLHLQLLPSIKHKAESTDGNNIEAFYIFYFDYDGNILFKFLFLKCEKEIIRCQKRRRNAFTYLLGFLFHFIWETLFTLFLTAFHHQNYVFEGWKFILKILNVWIMNKKLLWITKLTMNCLCKLFSILWSSEIL